MGKLVLEVGMPLDKNLIYYHDMLIAHGLYLSFACVTHDMYYTKEKTLDGLTENQMKEACIRIRKIESVIGVNKGETKTDAQIMAQEDELIKQGYHKIFDTIKLDFQYKKSDWYNYIQLQDIKDVGLLVYWEHDIFYDLPEVVQHKKLLEELNEYGFEFKETDLGIDKLRTLYYGRPMYSINQNA